MVQQPTQQTLPRWKLDLIRARAIRHGFCGADLEDVQQEIAIEALAFGFRRDRANGATEATALTAMIDRRLAMARRRERRYQRRLDQVRGFADLSAEPTEPSCEERITSVLDVRSAIATLSPVDQEICRALADGDSIDAIAQRLGCGWHTVKRQVDRLRERFAQMGLDGNCR